MKNLISLFTLLLVCSQFSFAQITVGARGGITLATVNDNTKDDSFGGFEKGNLLGVDVALFSTIGIYDFFSIQPEVHWIQKGAMYTKTLTDDMDVTMTFKYNYIDVPVLARVDLGTKVVGVYVIAGPSVGYGLDGKFIGKNVQLGGESPEEGDFEQDIEWIKEYNDDGVKDNRWDISGVAGVGLNVDLNVVKLVIDARYSMDFNDRCSYETTPDPEPDKIYNRGAAFTAGIAIPLNR